MERLDQYATNLPVEGHSSTVDSDHKLKSWEPSRCDIDFKDVYLKYREGLPFALNDLSFHIKGGEKVGICGRTGAGKSTIISALFRFVELSSGEIKLDNQNIADLPLETLRSNFAIIPQSPVLFQGTVKSNLDPFGQYDDHQLNAALEEAGVSEKDLQVKFNLYASIEAEGTNMSLGERQIIALARVMVRNSRILILDEATAAVDFETDKKIQRAIKSKFKDRTVLCIAHRLETIIDYDKIIVMGSGGVLLEMGSPRELYNRNGVFTDMCEESGLKVVFN